MDEVFWASVVKKWSEASEKALALKKELEISQEQCSEYHHQLLSIQACSQSSPSAGNEGLTYSEDSAVQRVKEAEDGLNRARSEYHRLKEELLASRNQVDVLNAKNSQLQIERQTLLNHSNELAEILSKVQSDLAKALSENESVNRKISCLESPHVATVGIHPLDKNSVFCESSWQDKISSLQEEIECLKGSLETREDENQETYRSLSVARDNLLKMKATNNMLLVTIENLQTIAKNTFCPIITPDKHQLTNNLPAATSLTNNHPIVPSSTQETPKTMGKTYNHQVSNTKSQSLLDLLKNDDVTFVEQTSSTLSSIPLPRQSILASFPLIVPDIDGDATENCFSRELLTTSLGGGSQSLIVRITESQTPLAKSRDMSCYLCPGLDHNPWCPSIPGQHGYLFVGLGNEKDTFSSPEIRNVFVGIKNKGQRRRRYVYLGIYEVVRVVPLATDEWKSLSSAAMYSKSTKSKTPNDRRTLQQIHYAYEIGELSIPCIQLRCIGFDKELYSAIMHRNQLVNPRLLDTSRAKRTRNDVEKDSDVSVKERLHRSSRIDSIQKR